MAFYFYDSDAIVKMWLFEPGHETTLKMSTEPSNTILITDFSLLEVFSALKSNFLHDEITKRIYQQACEEFEALVARLSGAEGNVRVIGVDSDVVEDGLNLVRRHNLRPGDALQLAAAISCTGVDVTLVTGDRRMIKAATSEGLAALNVNECHCPRCNGLMKPNYVSKTCLECGHVQTVWSGATCEKCQEVCNACRNTKWCERLMLTQRV